MNRCGIVLSVRLCLIIDRNRSGACGGHLPLLFVDSTGNWNRHRHWHTFVISTLWFSETFAQSKNGNGKCWLKNIFKF